LVSIIAGLSCAGLFSFSVPVVLLLPLLTASLAAVLLENRAFFLVALALTLFCWGNVSVKPLIQPDHQAGHIARYVADEPVAVEGVIDRRPEVTEKGSKLYLQVDHLFKRGQQAAVVGRLLLYIGEGTVTLQTGDRLRFISRLQKPRNHGLPGEFDLPRYLALKNVFVTGFVRGADDIVLLRQGVAFPWQRRLDSLAAEFNRFIAEAVPGPEGGILRALLLGERGFVPQALEDAYSRTGVNHILSISGFHVGIISLVIFQLLLAAARSSEFLILHCNLRKIMLLTTLPVIVFYLFLTGAAPATTRSVVMIAAFVVALFLERETDPINNLMLAALVILAFTPEALFDISFQFSFLALWGILILTPIFMTPFKDMSSSVLRKLLLFLMVSAAATVATIVPVLYYFSRMSFTGLISNFFVVPLMGYGAVVLGFTALPLRYLFPPLAELFLKAAAVLVHLSNEGIIFLDRIPTFHLYSPGRSDLFLFCLILAALTFITAKRPRLLCSAVLTIMLVGKPLLVADPDAGKLKVSFLSVGQGEATLVAFPDGKRMLVDGGGATHDGAANVGERLLAPALWKMGVSRIDYMVLTHNHPDHLQGLMYIAANFKVGEFWETGIAAGGRDYRELRRILAERGVPVKIVAASARPLMVGGTQVEILSPAIVSAPAAVADPDPNDASLVFRLVYGRFSLLFTGDIGAATEEQLSKRPNLLKCTVLKVAHHGSRFSSTPAFLAAASPEIAVISAGYKNSFHLPAPQTLAAFERQGVRVYRTDLDGTLHMTSDAGQVSYAVSRIAP
jgi:competence protein ComEC